MEASLACRIDQVGRHTTGGQAAPARPLVLLVDDVPECVELMAAVLEATYDVRTAVSGREALRAARMEPVPDVIVLDVVMPDIDGYSVLASLRKDPRTADVPVIFLTMLDGATHEVYSLDEGAADFIAKPALPEVVLARVQCQIELKRMRTRLREQNAALQEEVRRRAAVEDRLQRSVADLQAFGYSMSHDLRAPLASIGAYASALREAESGRLSDRSQRWLERIEAGARRMEGMIDDILAVARADHCAMQPVQLDLAALVADVVAEIAPAYPATTVAVGSLPVVRGDAAMMRRVLANLVENAFKFSGRRSGAEVRIDGCEAQGRHVITVRDNGAGFDMAQADKLFRLFQRLHDDAEFPGTGVGLCIVKRFVERHAGQVAASVLDDWTTFTVSLPR